MEAYKNHQAKLYIIYKMWYTIGVTKQSSIGGKSMAFIKRKQKQTEKAKKAEKEFKAGRHDKLCGRYVYVHERT